MTDAAAATGADNSAGAVAARAGGDGASAKVPAIAQGDASAGAQPDFRAGWDDTLKNDPSLKDFKTPADLAKSYVETKKAYGTLASQKAGIPGPDATPEQKAAFYKTLGVPDTEDGYGLVTPEGLPEHLKEHYSGDMLKFFGATAKKYNLTPEQAKGIQKDYDAKFGEFLTAAQQDVSKSDEQFDQLATKLFGDKKTEALQQARVDIEKYVPEAIRADMKNMPNAALLAIAAAVHGKTKDLGGEDRVTGGGTPAGVKTPAEIRAEARELMKLPEYNSAFAKGAEEHEKVKKRARELYQQADALERKAG